jgi:hypothetical protein
MKQFLVTLKEYSNASSLDIFAKLNETYAVEKVAAYDCDPECWEPVHDADGQFVA